MSNAVEIRGLSKSYGKVKALDAVSFDVPRGSLFGLIGPDGAGKSTLYQILTTMLVPDGGTATVAGLDVVADYRKIRSIVGYMPERFSLYPDLTVNENLHFFASLFGVSVKDNYDLIAPFFDQLAKFPDRRAGALSGGMKQKLALGCALIHRPEILLLDEPTTRGTALRTNRANQPWTHTQGRHTGASCRRHRREPLCRFGTRDVSSPTRLARNPLGQGLLYLRRDTACCGWR